ncbi:MAG: sulfatase [Myxococcota bacterium]
MVLGLGLIGYGVLRGAPSDDATADATATPSPPSPAGGPATGPTGMVSPGAVTVTADAPTDTLVPKDAPCAGCDVVLITVCSLRKDYVSAYGVNPGLTPTIDALAAEGFHFDRTYAASNFTLASLTAVLTGRFGSSTGVTGWDKGLVEDVPTLPEVLGYYGFATAGFTIDAPSGFRPDYGLHRGFQRMEIIPPPRDTPDGRHRGGSIGPGGASAAPAVKWISAQPTDKPMFAMLHTRSAHFPFVIEDPSDDEDPTGVLQALWDEGKRNQNKPAGAMPGMAGGTAQQGVVDMGGDPLQELVAKVGEPGIEVWRKAYADSVARMDLDVKAVVEAVKARGRLDRTIFVVVADHGESLYDHDEALHGDAYYDSVVNVPLVMKVPGMKARPEAIGALTSQVDVLPTLLELVGGVAPAGIDGKSLLPLLRGEADAVRGVALVEGGVAKAVTNDMRGAVIALPWALVRQARGCGGPVSDDPPRKPGEAATCLYDMASDPGQTKNLALKNPAVVEDLLARWKSFRDTRGADAKQLALDDAFVEQLRKSGYDFRNDGSP